MPTIETTPFTLNKKFVAGPAAVSLEISAPDAPALTTALQNPEAAIPPGDLTLGRIKANTEAGVPVSFGGDAKGKVEFSAEAQAAIHLGIYADAAEAIKAAAPAPELAAGLQIEHPASTRYIVLGASYDIKGSAKGSVALGVGVQANFGVSGSSSGGFAVLHRFADSEPAVKVFQDLFDSWALPRQISRATDLPPGSWIIAEVDGSFAMQVGVQAGYDFSWLRKIPGGALQGDIGLRIQLGASAALGFEASGKYAIVLGRESDKEVLRLRLYKMAKKGWDFPFDARVGIKRQLPPFFDQPHKAEDLIAAIFGLNQNQIIDVLRETRAFVNGNVSLQDKLAGVLMDLGGTALEDITGLSEDQIRNIYEAGRSKVVNFLAKFDSLLKNGGHELASMLLSLGGPDVTGLQTVLQDIAGAENEAGVQTLVRDLAGKVGFERSPAGRFLEAAAGSLLGALTDTDVAKRVQSIAGDALAVLDGDTLQKLLDFIRRKISLDKIQAVVDQTGFDNLDNLLKSRLAEFLGKQKVLMDDLNQVQAAIKNIFSQADKFYDMALKLATQKQEFAFAARYSQSSTRTALVDISFDTSGDGNAAELRKAIDGDLSSILLNQTPGVTINAAELTHNIARNVSSELTMPFGAISDAAGMLSTAKLTVQEDGGRVLVFALDMSSKESERSGWFRARSGRDSTLTVAATMPVGVVGGLKIWRDAAFSYSYRMERAVLRMRASQLLAEISPYVETYLPASFSSPKAHSFPEWVADLDKLLDNMDPNSGTHDIGDTLISLHLSAPPAYLKAWTKAPKDKKDPIYMDLSRSLQAKLKELVTFYYFSDPARYKNLDASAAPVVYSCIPVSTSIRLNADEGVDRLNTNRDLYWDQANIQQIRAMTRSPWTFNALTNRLQTVSTMLRGIPELADCAQFYALSQAGTIIEQSLKRYYATSPVPELLGSLLFLEASLIENAVEAGVKMAQFREMAGAKPADALQSLAEFGDNLGKAFNEAIGSHPYLSEASRPLATLLFMEAATAFDRAVTGGISALMNITVIRSGKLSPEDLLAGKIAADPEIILYEQPFVQA